MNNESIVEYMSNVKLLSKEISEYYNQETGVKKIIPTSYLLCSLDYMELTEAELEKAKFDMIIEKNIDFDTKMVVRPRPKFEITKNEADKNKLVDGKVKVYCIWNLTNSLRLKKSFNNKEEALELYEKINKPILDIILNK